MPLLGNIKKRLHRLSDNYSGRKAAWSGFKLCVEQLEKRADVFGPLKSAIDGFARCIDIFERMAQNREEYILLRTELDALFWNLNNLWSGPAPPGITPMLDILAKGILREIENVVQKDRANLVERIAELTQYENEVLECYRRIQRLLQRVMMNVNLDTWRMIEKLATDTRLKNLSPSETAWYNSGSSNLPLRGGCTPQTRIDVLQALETWAEKNQTQNIYWLNGMAGTGKTTIAYSLCEYLERSGRLAASFFCSRQVPECKTVHAIIPMISYQLAIISGHFKLALSRAIEQDPKAHTLKLEEQFRKLIVEPLKEVELTMPEDLVVVIDALDECDSKDGVAQMLKTLLSHAPSLKLKFFTTSRPEPQIRNQMSSGDRSTRLNMHLHELDESIVKEDIRTYLKDKLQPINIPDQKLELLARRSGALFIYAATAVRFISHQNFEWSTKRLELVLNIAESPSGSNYKEIDKLYSEILDKALRDTANDPDENALMADVLHTVVCAQEPLTLDVVAGLLGMDAIAAIQPAMTPLVSVLNVSESSGLVTTLHESFRDYSFSSVRSGRFYCDQKRHHARLAQQCLALLINAKPEFNICRLESSYVRDVDLPDLEERVNRYIPKDLLYACRYWGDHVASMDSNPAFLNMLERFLSTRLLLWMSTECPQQLQHLVQDAWKFTINIASSRIEESTPHIYVSDLALWPRGRPVGESYSRQAKWLIEMTGTALRRRGSASLAVCEVDCLVNCIAYSPDGSSIVSGSGVNTIQIWDVHSGQMLEESFQGHTSQVMSVAYSPNGSHIISGSGDSTIRIWDTHSCQMIGEPLQGHSGPVGSVAYSPDGSCIISGSEDNTIRIWDAHTGQAIGEPLQGHTSRISSVKYSPDGSHIASGSWDCTTRIWDIHSSQAKGKSLQGHIRPITSISFSPDGSRIASGSEDKTIRIWNVCTGRMIGEPLQGHAGYVHSVAYSPDGSRIISGSDDNTICIWDAHSGQMITEPLQGHINKVTSVSYSPDGLRIVSGSWDKTIRIWDAHVDDIINEPLQCHTGYVYSVAYSPDGSHIASGSSDNTIQIWDAHTGQSIGEPLQGHTSYVFSVAYSPDGSRIVSGSGDNTIRIWDAHSGQMIGEPIQGHTSRVSSVTYSPDGSHIVSDYGPNGIQIWDAYTGQLIGTPLQGHTNYVYSLAYSLDGSRIVSGSGDNSVCVWNAHSGQMIGTPYQGHTGPVSSVAYSPNNSYIVSGSDDSTVRIWNALTGDMIREPLQGHTSFVYSVAFSPDGSRVVSGSGDNTIRVWDVQTGDIIGKPLLGHTGSVFSVAYSPDGSRIVSGSEDKTIRVWDAQTDQTSRNRRSHSMGLLHSSNFSNEPSSVTSSRSSSLDSAEANSGNALQHAEWKLNSNGWLVSQRSELLMWIPREMRSGLLYHPSILIISIMGWLRLNFTNARIGESWSSMRT